MFARAAIGLAGSNWLGPFDGLTLIKGPGYPLFIHASSRLGLSLSVATQITYLCGAAALSTALYLTIRRLWAATAAYLVLALDPMNLSADAARVMRDNWYTGVSLLLFSLVFVTTFLALGGGHLRRVAPLAVVTGIAAAGFWLTREDGVWLLPALLVVVGGLVLIRWRRGRVRATWPSAAAVARGFDPADAPVRGSGCAPARWGSLALVVVLAAGSFLLPITAVKVRNEAVYGAALTSDLGSGAFPPAYFGWARVRGVPLRDYVPIDREQREAVYAVSPAAAELRAVLEDPGNSWKGFGCASVGVCDDYAGGWLPWALRDAAAAAGHFGSEADFQAYFTRLHDEIAAACDDGRLDCAPALPVAIAPLLRVSPIDIVVSSGRSLAALPFADVFYAAPDPAAVHPIDPRERAVLGQAIVGVPATDAAAVAATTDHQRAAWVQTALGWLYEILFVGLAVFTLVGAMLAVRWRRERRANGPLIVLGMALGTGVLVRLGLFAVVDTTQFAIEARYHQATRTFLLAMLAVGAVGCVALVRAHRAVGRLGGSAAPAGQDSARAVTDRRCGPGSG